jgi:hypothetical protein
MPLKLNVGLCRKVGETNYGSRGASVHIELELESSLVGEPAKLQERIRQIFGIVRTSLAEELNGNGHSCTGGSAKVTNGAPAATPSTGNGSGDTAARPAPTSRAATQSQVRAIHAIAKEQGIQLTRLLRGRYQVDRPEELGIKKASELIDSLKSDKNREEA